MLSASIGKRNSELYPYQVKANIDQIFRTEKEARAYLNSLLEL